MMACLRWRMAARRQRSSSSATSGSSLWPAFSGSAEAGDGAPHPLNRWTQRVVGEIAREVGAMPLFPFGGPPYLPFQRWAMRAEAVAPSPLGILIHPDYGLWHAYRGALAFAERLALPPRVERPRPCDSCAGAALPFRLPGRRLQRPGLRRCRRASGISAARTAAPAGTAAAWPGAPARSVRTTVMAPPRPGFTWPPSWRLIAMVNVIVTIFLPFFPYDEDRR